MWKVFRNKTKKSLIHLFLVRLDICTDGTYQLDFILYGSEAEKHKRILFFQIKIKWSFSLVSDILFIRVGYRRQVQCILTFIKLALCLLLENMERVLYIFPGRTWRNPTNRNIRKFQVLYYSMYFNTEKKWISLYVDYPVKRAPSKTLHRNTYQYKLCKLGLFRRNSRLKLFPVVQCLCILNIKVFCVSIKISLSIMTH